MYTNTQLQLLRNANSGAPIPGVDTTTGNSLSPSSLIPLSALPTDNRAPIYYRPGPNTVIVQQDGATLNGYDFGSATVAVAANNVTIENSAFTGTTGWQAVHVYPGKSNTTVTHDTFDSGKALLPLAAWIMAGDPVTITDNRFIDTPSDAIDASGGGVISGNFFSGAGYTSNGGHPDAIWISNSSAPMSITGNFIDWTQNADAAATNNNAIRITAEFGGVSNVTVTDNDLFGGLYAVDAGNFGSAGTFSNIAIADNHIGFSLYGPFYPGPAVGVSTSGNVVLDYSNSAYSAGAWQAYQAAGLPTANVLVSSGGRAVTAGSQRGPTTIHGSPHAVLQGGPHETNFVGGEGTQYMRGSFGANVFTYLSPSDSTPSARDYIANFDPAKDVIDLSNIDADVTPGVARAFTFIGSAAFGGDGGEVRYQQNPKSDSTDIQVALTGDTKPDMDIVIQGLVTPSEANFAFTAAQSQADMAAGAALSIAASGNWPMNAYQYSSVAGRPSYAAVYVKNTLVADALDLSPSSGELDLMSVANTAFDGVTVTRGAGQQTLGGNAVGKTLDLPWRANETIEAGNAGISETFALSSGFGDVKIDGFALSGKNADTLELSTAAFSDLSPGMTQAQDLAALLAHASTGANGLTIADDAGDRLTLSGVTADALSSNPGAVKFV